MIGCWFGSLAYSERSELRAQNSPQQNRSGFCCSSRTPGSSVGPQLGLVADVRHHDGPVHPGVFPLPPDASDDGSAVRWDSALCRVRTSTGWLLPSECVWLVLAKPLPPEGRAGFCSVWPSRFCWFLSNCSAWTGSEPFYWIMFWFIGSEPVSGWFLLMQINFSL